MFTNNFGARRSNVNKLVHVTSRNEGITMYYGSNFLVACIREIDIKVSDSNVLDILFT